MVKVSVGHPGNEVHGPGAKRRDTDPRATGQPAIPVRHKRRPLLMPCGHELYGRLGYRVEDVHDLLAWDTEDVLYALVFEALCQ
jgi:hypothetical protein